MQVQGIKRAASTRSTVLIADAQPIFRDGVARAVKGRAELRLIGETSDSEEALACIRTLSPDVALIDGDLADLSGLGLVRQLAKEGARCRAVLVLGAVDGPVAYEAIASGAAGLVSRRLSADTLTDAVVAVGRGEIVLNPPLQSELAAEIKHRARANRSVVSQREVEILQAIADGRGVDEAASAMNLSTATVRAHLRSIYEKFGVPGQPQAIAAAMRKGLIR